MMTCSVFLKSFFTTVILLHGHQVLSTDVVSLNDNNINSVLGSSDIAIVNFYADWCRFSQILKPTFEEAGSKIKEYFPLPGKVVFAKVDSDKETGIAGKYRINKYPTIKLFRQGHVVKKEYRGQRSVEALVEFAKEQAKDPVQEISAIENVAQLDMGTKKRHIIGYFDNKESENYKTFVKASNVLRDECEFHSAVGEVSAAQRQNGENILIKVPNSEDLVYPGNLNDYDRLYQWASESCTPLVREITFENAEELTEENLPFLILFRHPDDKVSEQLFAEEVKKQILHEKVNVNFLVADGVKFAHPLHHLGKSSSDLPVLAIDSFRHMYVFPHSVKKDLETPGLLKKFVEDLHSGKLHREFHHGPDPTPEPAKEIEGGQAPGSEDPAGGDKVVNVPRDTSNDPKKAAPQKITSPPESTFKKLAPSKNRYTILRDEL